MRRPILSGAFTLLFLFGASAGLAAPSAELSVAAPGPGIVPGRYIVVLQDSVDAPTTARRLAAAHGMRLLSVYQHALKGFAAVIPDARVELLRQDPSVASIEPDRVIYALTQTLPTGVDRIEADQNALAAIDGVDTRVDVDLAVIDTGVDLDHPDLNVYRFTDCVDADLIGWLFGITCIDDNDPLNDGTLGNDLNGHGSHVAGIAAAKDNGIGVVGVAPGARIWSVAVLDATGSGYLYWLVNGIDWVAAHANEIDVANMSLGWQGNSAAARTAVQNAVNQGVVFVVAAGNSAQDIYGPDHVFGNSDDFEPASYPEAAAISALVDTDGQAGGLGPSTIRGPDDTLANFTNFSTTAVASNPVASPGKGIDVAAPGVNIYSTYKDGGYATLSGTSMASPHAAGAAALYIAENGRATTASGAAFIRQQLINAAQPQTQWGPADTKDRDSNNEGLVQVGEAAPPEPEPEPDPTPTAPAAPSNLTATAGATGTGRNKVPFVDLAWQDNSDNEDNFVLERCTVSGKGQSATCGSTVQITVGANTASYHDASVVKGTTYRYKVKATNSVGDSAFSNQVQVKTP
jgi:subtilisin family serine protease